jgi:hypothetical protein
MTRSGRLRLALLPVAFSALLLAGCSGSPRVEGTVTLDNQPVDDGTISFFPEGSRETGSSASGEIKNGKYSIESPNLKPGSYRVEIYWFKKTGKQVANPNDPGTKIDEARQVIPDEYNRNTKFKFELKSGTNPFNFELRSGGVISGAGPGAGGKVDDDTRPNRK